MWSIGHQFCKGLSKDMQYLCDWSLNLMMLGWGKNVHISKRYP